MTYTATEIVTFIAAIGVLLTGVGAIIVNVIVALRTGAKIDEAAKKTDDLVSQVEQVHTLTNSGLSAVKAELATSNALNAQLRDIIADLRAERGKMSLIAAREMPVAPVGAPGGDAVEHLEEIEVATKETAVNTKQAERAAARTEAVINEKLPGGAL